MSIGCNENAEYSIVVQQTWITYKCLGSCIHWQPYCIINDIWLFVLKKYRSVDLGRALVCAEFGSSRDASHMDAKFRSFRAVIEKVHG